MTQQTTHPISKIRSGEVAVRLTDIEQFKKIAPEQESFGAYEENCYHAYEPIENEGDPLELFWQSDMELQEFTDLIDFSQIDWEEGKEEVNKCEISPIYVSNLESEINRLKWELDKWKDEAALWNTRYHHVLSNLTDKTNELNKLRESPQISQNLEKRERMAWELYVSGFNHGIADKWTIAECYRSANIFINYKGGDDEQ